MTSVACDGMPSKSELETNLINARGLSVPDRQRIHLPDWTG